MERPSSGAAKFHFHQWIPALLVAALFGMGAIWIPFRDSTHQPLPPGVSIDDYNSAKKTFERAHKRGADRNDILQMLAERAITQRQLEIANNCFSQIPKTHPIYGRMAKYGQAITLDGMNRAVEAEIELREVISLEETSPKIKPEYLIHARQRLRHLFEAELRFEERHQLLRGIIARGEEQAYEPVIACFPSLVRWNCADSILWIEHYWAHNPDDPALNIALGRFRTVQGRIEKAREILDSVLRQHPHNLNALAALIACLRESDSEEELSRVRKSLPPQSLHDPWLLLLQRGALALQDGDKETAAAAYHQLLQQDRTNIEAWQGLIFATRQTNDEQYIHSLKMLAALGRIQSLLGRSIQESTNASSFLDVADECAEVSLNWEGAVMTRCAQRLTPSDQRVINTATLFRERLAMENPQLLQGN